jgi:lipid A ethanolaminephosphotransferase
MIQMMCDGADSVIYLNGQHDGSMLDPLCEAIQNDSSDLFVLMHSYGSHFNYAERYPAEFSRYTPDDDVSISRKNRERMVNAYDNSILYTDWFISQIIKTLNDEKCCSAMFYCSDHGEDLYDDRRGRFLHSSPTITYYQAHVACLGWYSEAWREANPEKALATENNTFAPATTHSVFHTVAQLAEIESEYISSKVSLVSSEFDYDVERHYLSDHCEPKRYIDMGLNRDDVKEFAMRDINEL